MDWDNYRAFLEVFRSGDLGHAAHGLEMSVPTVRRRLDAVESKIGFPLFERTPRGLTPTPVARRLVHNIATMSDLAAVAGTLKEGPIQSVTVLADEGLALFISETAWADLRQLYPGLTVSIVTRRAASEFFEVRADVAISHRPPMAGRAGARRLGALDVGLFAHRDYLSHAGAPEDAADLRRFCMVAPESEDDMSWMEARLGLSGGGVRCALRTDSYAGRLAAIEAGVGVGVCHVNVARQRPGLARVLPAVGASLECWAWSPRFQLRGESAGLVIESLLAAFADQMVVSAARTSTRQAVANLNTIAA